MQYSMMNYPELVPHVKHPGKSVQLWPTQSHCPVVMQQLTWSSGLPPSALYLGQLFCSPVSARSVSPDPSFTWFLSQMLKEVIHFCQCLVKICFFFPSKRALKLCTDVLQSSLQALELQLCRELILNSTISMQPSYFVSYSLHWFLHMSQCLFCLRHKDVFLDWCVWAFHHVLLMTHTLFCIFSNRFFSPMLIVQQEFKKKVCQVSFFFFLYHSGEQHFPSLCQESLIK